MSDETTRREPSLFVDRDEDGRPKRPDPRERPRDPAGTQPRHDPDALLPTQGGRLAYRRGPDGAAGSVDTTAEELADREELPRGDAGEPAGGEATPGPLAPLEDEAGGALAASSPAAEIPQASRFQFLTGALLALGVAGVAVLLLLLFAPDDKTQTITILGPRWSSWAPRQGAGDGATQIATHVAREYRLADGRQLVAVTGGPLEVAGLPLTVALRQTPAQGGDIRLLQGKGVLYRMCGLGEKCSIVEGKASRSRHLLLRREALEMALYSFRYLEGVNEVVVFLPPRKGQDPSQALFFRPGDVAHELDRPLSATLTGRTPSVHSVTRSADAGLVNTITLQSLFQFSLTQANQDTQAFLVLDPLGTK